MNNNITRNNIRHAKPGEFTEKAFLNDKIDLTQAEAVSDLITSRSLSAVKGAYNSLRGRFSDKILEASDKVLEVRAKILLIRKNTTRLARASIQCTASNRQPSSCSVWVSP